MAGAEHCVMNGLRCRKMYTFLKLDWEYNHLIKGNPFFFIFIFFFCICCYIEKCFCVCARPSNYVVGVSEDGSPNQVA
jgi:hypothetical protein